MSQLSVGCFLLAQQMRMFGPFLAKAPEPKGHLYTKPVRNLLDLEEG